MGYAIFDMDGLLIDSEPLWRRAETEVFQDLGVPLTEQMCMQTMGLRVDEVVAYWYARHPWTGVEHSAVADAVVDRVRQVLEADGQPLPGVHTTIECLRTAGWRLGLASSSPMDLIRAGVRTLGLHDAFEHLCSAADEARGKPDPAVYLTAARRLDVEPAQCVAFEDSVVGVESARAAGMRVVAVPAPENFHDPRYKHATWKLRSLKDFDLALVDVQLG